MNEDSESEFFSTYAQNYTEPEVVWLSRVIAQVSKCGYDCVTHGDCRVHNPASPDGNWINLTRGERESMESWLLALWNSASVDGARTFINLALEEVEKIKTAAVLIAADEAREELARAEAMRSGR